jgi:hypothetical protein
MAIHYLAKGEGRDTKIVEMILAHPRCNPNEVNLDSCSTALHLAVHIKSKEVIQLLAGSHKVSSAKRNKQGLTPLETAKEQWITDLLLKSHVERVNQLAKMRQQFEPSLKIVPVPPLPSSSSSSSAVAVNGWYAFRG